MIIKDVPYFMTNAKICGRFAPTPSGRIHLGNIFCSLLAWLHAKSQGGEIVLRIEDLDKVRCPRPNADLLAKDLEWLGLTWDKGAYVDVDSERYFQSQRFDIYAEHFAKLEEQGLIYPCFCTRGQLHAAEAPHLSDGRILYAGTCKNLTASERLERAKTRQPAYRLSVNDEPICFTDLNYGEQSYNLMEESGDFIVRRSDGVYAYQLAVTIDDALMGVTHVVRGCDLLSSTPMQIYIYKLLGFNPPEFLHIPLLMAPDGRRLAKRDKDLDLSMMRQQYDSPEPIIGYLAYLAGQIPKAEPISTIELAKIFKPELIPTDNIAVPPQLPEL